MKVASPGEEGKDTLESLVDRLVADLRPVRPVRPAGVFATIVALQACAALGGGLVFGLRGNLGEMFAQPAFASLVVALVLGALAAAWIASRLAFPGRAVSHGGSRLLAMFPVLLAAAVLVAAPWGGHWQSWARMSVESAGCIAVVVMTAALPWGATLYLMGRLAPLNELRAAMFTGLSALFVGSLVVQLHCPANSSYHLAFAHLLPVLVVSLLSCLAAVAVLRAGRSLQSP